MLNTVFRKRARLLAPILVLLLLLTAAAAFAATKLIKASQGGKLNIAPGVRLVIQPDALEEDTVISANVALKGKRIYFECGPEGLQFKIPAELQVSWKTIERFGGLDDLTLYGDHGLRMEPEITKKGVKYYLDHFSLYYFRRR